MNMMSIIRIKTLGKTRINRTNIVLMMSHLSLRKICLLVFLIKTHFKILHLKCSKIC